MHTHTCEHGNALILICTMCVCANQTLVHAHTRFDNGTGNMYGEQQHKYLPAKQRRGANISCKESADDTVIIRHPMQACKAALQTQIRSDT